MAALFGGLWVFIWILALTKIIGGVTAAGKKAKQGSLGGPSASGGSGSVRPASVRRLQPSGSGSYDARETSLGGPRTAQHSNAAGRISNMAGTIEDRQNDWLARQLREEDWIAKHSKLDLGAAHERECAADEVKIRRKK